ncbi:MAG: PadR family transcriptional regulator [Desulfurococcales archaeon]|nr:PadR family transcriptional regulator [Desulfurococcales archaeon]
MDGTDTKALQRLKRKLTIENLWIYVIAVLVEEGPTYGYDIKKRIATRFGFKVSPVTLYTVLYRMEREGLLEKEGGYYKPTKIGREAYTRALEYIAEILAKLTMPS